MNIIYQNHCNLLNLHKYIIIVILYIINIAKMLDAAKWPFYFILYINSLTSRSTYLLRVYLIAELGVSYFINNSF